MGLVVLEMLMFLVKVAQITGVVAATGLRAVVARRIVFIPTFVITVFFSFPSSNKISAKLLPPF